MTARRRVYLDHGATSWPKAPGVADAMVRYLDEEAGNPGRGGHRLTVAASRAVESAREDVAAPVSYTHLRAHETRYTISYSVLCL